MARMVADGAPGADYRAYAKKMDDKCAQKARERGQQTFTLIEQDASAPRTILFWIMENFDGRTPPEKLRDAFEDALAMLFSPVAKKRPD